MAIFLSFLFGTLGFDFLTKYLTTLWLKPFHSHSLIGTFLQFTYVQNRGAAFGILPGKQFLLIAVSVIVAGAILWYIWKERPRAQLLLAGLGCLLGGTLGNLYNRAIQGYVIDFIDLNFWPTFNIADIAINLGVLLLIIHLVKSDTAKKVPSKKRR